jgi:hypothetical protein
MGFVLKANPDLPQNIDTGVLKVKTLVSLPNGLKLLNAVNNNDTFFESPESNIVLGMMFCGSGRTKWRKQHLVKQKSSASSLTSFQIAGADHHANSFKKNWLHRPRNSYYLILKAI